MTTPRATPGDGRPSAAARTRLAEELAAQVATSRMAWDAALLRSDVALASDDEAEIQAALDDHRLLLRSLEERLGEVVAAATASREVALASDDEAAVADDEAPVTTGGPAARHRTSSKGRRVASALVGAAAAVLAVVGLAHLELPVETAEQVAGSAVPDRDVVVGHRTASERVGGAPGTERNHEDGRRSELPAFSGELPATASTASSAGTVDVGEEPDGASPSTRADDDARQRASRFDAPPDLDRSPIDPVEDEVTDGAPSARPLAGLADRADRTDDVDADVGAGTSRPLHELAETLREGLSPGPASEPRSGLG